MHGNCRFNLLDLRFTRARTYTHAPTQVYHGLRLVCVAPVWRVGNVNMAIEWIAQFCRLAVRGRKENEHN